MKTLSHLILLLTLSFFMSAVEAGDPAIITEVSDSLGNLQTNSLGDDQQLSWPADVQTPVVVEIGDSITFTAQASDPDSQDFEFKFEVQPPGGSFELRQDWSPSNTWTWTVNPAEFGPDVTVIISVRDDDGLDFFGQFSGDDYTYATYNVRDPNGSLQPMLKQVGDSLGNVQTNSFATNGTANWPSNVSQPVQIFVGDQISFVAESDYSPASQLEYQFSVQAPGGSFETIQNWSTDNTVNWVVQENQYGPEVTVLIAIRNTDGLNTFGSSGDDYTYAIYSVDDPNASSPARLSAVTDSLGNSQTNSFGSNQNADWPSTVSSPVTVVVGNEITITAQAIDSDSEALEYRFSVQRVGGSFETRRDWSADSTWVWKPTTADFGQSLTVLVAVRDDDNRDFFGADSGDDYTYLTYTVRIVPISAIQLVL